MFTDEIWEREWNFRIEPFGSDDNRQWDVVIAHYPSGRMIGHASGREFQSAYENAVRQALEWGEWLPDERRFEREAQADDVSRAAWLGIGTNGTRRRSHNGHH